MKKFIIFASLLITILNGEESHSNINNTIKTLANNLSLTYGSLLNINCKNNDDCILKNSVCNIFTKRCECDFNAIPDDNRCQTLRCVTNQDCWSHFENTICVFGSCRCKLGLKANGKCVDIDVPGINSKSLPDWAISLIAITALLSGIWSGRSQFMSQLVRQLISLLVLITGHFAQNNNRNIDGDVNNSNGQQGQSILGDQSAMITTTTTTIFNNDVYQQQDEQKEKMSHSRASLNHLDQPVLATTIME